SPSRGAVSNVRYMRWRGKKCPSATRTPEYSYSDRAPFFRSGGVPERQGGDAELRGPSSTCPRSERFSPRSELDMCEGGHVELRSRRKKVRGRRKLLRVRRCG